MFFVLFQKSKTKLNKSIKYSQNSLKSRRLVAELIEKSSINNRDCVYEIGSGNGIITSQVIGKVNKLVAFEIDSSLCQMLQEKLGHEKRLEIKCCDFLECNLPKGEYKVFSNIPFNKTAEIFKKLFFSKNPPIDSYLVVQKEAAERFGGKDVGITENQFSILLKPWFELSFLHEFKRNDFDPKVSVDTVFLRVNRRGNALVCIEFKNLYKDFVVYSFNQGKANLRKNLKSLFSFKQFKMHSSKFDFALNSNPTDLDFEHWLKLFGEFKKLSCEKRDLVKGSYRKLSSQQKNIKKIYRTRLDPNWKSKQIINDSYLNYYTDDMCMYKSYLQSKMNDPPQSFLDELREYLIQNNFKEYRYTQILYAIFKQRKGTFKVMKNLPKKLRGNLANEFNLFKEIKVVNHCKSKQSEKVVFRTADGAEYEAVLLEFKKGTNSYKSLCLSSQAGCPVGCKFCWTGQLGFRRNLTVDEIIYQLFYFWWRGENVRSISFMGMGEPLLNYENIKKATEIFTNNKMFNISMRKINVSTVGIINPLIKLVDDYTNVNVAFSLHSPFEKQRMELIPSTKNNSTKEIFEILDKHVRKNKRKVFIAYLLLGSVNDSDKHLNSLINLIKSRPNSYLYHVNLIEYNSNDLSLEQTRRRISFHRDYLIRKPTINKVGSNLKENIDKTADGVQRRYFNLCESNRSVETQLDKSNKKIAFPHKPYRRSERLKHFYQMLNKAGINTTIRQSFGEEMNSGCGQMVGSKLRIND